MNQDVKKGDVVNLKNIKIVRPGLGMHPENLHNILGHKFNRDLNFATPLLKEYLDE